MDATPLQLGKQAVDTGRRYGRIASTILRSGIVPARLDRGVQLLPDVLRYGTTLTGLYAAAARAVGDRPAIHDDHGMLTYRELDDRVRALTVGLVRRHGIGPGDAVGLLARNHAGFVETMLACGRLGAHTILLNTGMSANQAAVVAEQQQLKLIVVDPDLVEKMAEADGRTPRLICGEPSAEHDLYGTAELIRDSRGGEIPDPPDEPGRTVVMTSGTTGAPKGAKRPTSGGPEALAAILSRIPFRADGTAYIAPPLFHTWGLATLQLSAAMRSTVVIRRRFDPAEAMALVSTHRCSTMAVVPVMLQRILDLPPEQRPLRDVSCLRVVASSGSALPGPLATRWMQAYGPNLYNLYGSTEASWATIATPEDLQASPGTAGRPPMGTALAILDEDGREVPQGEVGRIFVGNDLQFEGYTGDVPGKEIIDGLMSTGDMGHIDEAGRLYVSGRDDDMIVSGGENVFPKEVEDLLAGRDDIREVAVIGVPDEEFGQRLVAFVVRRDEEASTPDEEELRGFVKQKLASFSVPREVRFVEELPRNPTGKVVARELRSMLPDG